MKNMKMWLWLSVLETRYSAFVTIWKKFSQNTPSKPPSLSAYFDVETLCMDKIPETVCKENCQLQSRLGEVEIGCDILILENQKILESVQLLNDDL